MTLPSTTEERAAKLMQEQARRQDAALATQEYHAKKAATLLKTERLRAERLEREAAAAQAETAEPRSIPRKTAKRPRR